ncbi:MAG: AAA family ATPase [Firmicutes bacterium]|nr:AAA family ATPase [Bacillota bacterium]
MGRYLNPTYNGFEEARNSEIYVDKSGLIDITNKYLGTQTKYICISRPRRFGKTMAARMLTAYYCKGYDSRFLFDDLQIAHTQNYNKYINKFNVLFLNIENFRVKTRDIDEMISYLQKEVISELGETYSEISGEKFLSDALEKIFIKHNEKFVVIIDEWDSVFREYRDKPEYQKQYLDFLKDMLKDRDYAALAYMTGILPIRKYGTHSALNMFSEFSMLRMKGFSEYTGFTTSEVKTLCDSNNVDFNKMERWYNGYLIENRHIYNPQSVVNSISEKSFENYWTRTETFEALKYYIDLNVEGLKDDVVKLISGQKIKINPLRFANDMSTFNSKDDIFTLLVHLGYLSFDGGTSEVFVPNEEIKTEFANAVEGSEWGDISKAIESSDKLLEATLALDETSVARYIDAAHSSNTAILKYNDENSLSCVIAIAYYTASKFYKVVRELPAGKGFADMVFVPRKNVDKPALLIELKWDDSAESALQQIKNKNYVGALDEYKGNILLVGINYDKTSKNHICKIERA